ncbi:type II toxin-antitoxin system VapC family toxin [Methanotrichaceae archaeon M04Ac]|jgi:predicted nucleic acid-binding protein|uniref:Ribonuclease VapC n=1 Tax=Candidatus Methanocrinis alkalitolerans TaxID=3033395 RepID=A0ABT5XGX9_9EURY|nr:type II toxin-antitoxin system VapC family toxin [Candidatus Methanocrinis alkalitolerans]MDF0593886.1 type II toxin-antitoxin system VapC family toxin [Candidatus Methanocrinis alkalitolerans]
MRDRAFFDSSVIAAIFFREEASPRSLKIAAEFDPTTLDLAVAEVGNVAWKRVTFSGEEKETALDALRDFLEFIGTTCTILNSSDLLVEAFEIAVTDEISFYDSLFLAAAERERLPLLTLDKRLHDRVKDKRDVRLV